jgi:hypothetical protein
VCVDLISQINGLCLAQLVVCGARVASPPRVTVEFELVRALAHERRRAGEGPSFGGRDEGHHDVGPPSSAATASSAAAAAGLNWLDRATRTIRWGFKYF